MNTYQTILLTGALSLAALSPLQAKQPIERHTFEQGQGTFLLDGKPFVVKAAELHYARIPQPYWEHRIQMCKSLGMNAICIYVFWNYHEMEEGVYDFSGDKDVARFVQLCQKNGMYVIVRPGPYVCAEWEMGGLPWWLLQKPDMNLRTLDPRFMEAAGRFERRLADELAPYRLENGGNILMVQVENEYGSYAKDKPYVSAMRDSLRAAGWNKTQLFQCDWSSNFTDNALDDLLWTMNFGTGAKIDKEFKKVGEMRPDAPKMCSEFWSGWFDGWGTAHQTRPWEPMVNGIKDMLDRGISFSLYMTHGGTSFDVWAGANNTGFAPDCTSYDYDAPINEQGATTEKFWKLRELLQNYSDTKLPAVPKAKPIVAVPQFEVSEFAPLYAPENLAAMKCNTSVYPQSFEQNGLGYGSILYSCQLPATQRPSTLTITDMCDYAVAFIDGKLLGRLYRGNGYENCLLVPALPNGGKLEIFIEAMGRINYSQLINDPKGITQSVVLATQTDGADIAYTLKNWEMRLVPTTYAFASGMTYGAADRIVQPAESRIVRDADPRNKAGYYRATFKVSKVGDTYLDLSQWSKGFVWVNGHNLGRFWNVGPQQTLYLPGCWLKKGNNEIIIMDIVGPKSTTVQGLTEPAIADLHRENLPHDNFKLKQKGILPNKKNAANQVGNDAAPGAK